MKPAEPGIRKAAILVDSLSQKAADALLEQLDPRHAARVRQAVVDLDDVDPEERERVIEEFLRVGPMIPSRQPAGVELAGRLAEALALPDRPPRGEPEAKPKPDGPPFRFLRDAEADRLAGLLAGERSQTVALVLSHLPPEQAGAVLCRFPPAVMTEIVRRLIDLEETDAEVLREVEEGLRARLKQQVSMQRRRTAGAEAVRGILGAADRPTALRILGGLDGCDRTLADRFGPPPVRFEDLGRLDDRALGTVFCEADPAVAMTALVGAEPALVERLLRRLRPADAEALRRRLDHPGPLRLSDVEQSRRELAELARRLAIQGRIELSDGQPLLVA